MTPESRSGHALRPRIGFSATGRWVGTEATDASQVRLLTTKARRTRSTPVELLQHRPGTLMRPRHATHGITPSMDDSRLEEEEEEEEMEEVEEE